MHEARWILARLTCSRLACRQLAAKPKMQTKVTSGGECAAVAAGRGGCRAAAAPDLEVRQPPSPPGSATQQLLLALIKVPVLSCV